MLDELKTAKKVVGIKQSLKAAQDGNVLKAYIAEDADERVTQKLKEFCIENDVEIEYAETMKTLGKACGIDIGAAVAVIVNE